jgi:hypothetical protein
MTTDTNTKDDHKDSGESQDKGAKGHEPKGQDARAHNFEQFAKILHEVNGTGADDDDENEGEGTEETHEGDEPPRGGKKPGKSKPPKDLSELAETLGVKVSDLYGLEVPSSREGEQPFTLGKLKDLAAQQDEFAVRTLKLDSDRTKFERERIGAEEELTEILSLLPKEALKPEVMQKIRQRLEVKHSRERAAMLEIEGWNDASRREADLKGVYEHLKGYGIPETFMFQNFSAPVMRYALDNWRRAEMVRKALEAIEERKNPTPPRSKKQSSGKGPKTGENKSDDSGSTGKRVRAFMDTINQAAAADRRH